MSWHALGVVKGLGVVRQNVADCWARKGTSHQHLTANERVFHLLQGRMRVMSATKPGSSQKGAKPCVIVWQHYSGLVQYIGSDLRVNPWERPSTTPD